MAKVAYLWPEGLLARVCLEARGVPEHVHAVLCAAQHDLQRKDMYTRTEPRERTHTSMSTDMVIRLTFQSAHM